MTQFPLGPPGCWQGWALPGWLFSELPPHPSFSSDDVASTQPKGPSPTAHLVSTMCFSCVRNGHGIKGARQADLHPHSAHSQLVHKRSPQEHYVREALKGFSQSMQRE